MLVSEVVARCPMANCLMQLLLVEGGASVLFVRVGYYWMPLSFSFCHLSWTCVCSLAMCDVPPMLPAPPQYFLHCLKQLSSEVFKMDATFRQTCCKPRLKLESCSVIANRTILLLMNFFLYIRICMLFRVSVTLSNWDFFDYRQGRGLLCNQRTMYSDWSNFLPNHYFCFFPISVYIHFLLKKPKNKKPATKTTNPPPLTLKDLRSAGEQILDLTRSVFVFYEGHVCTKRANVQ